MYEIHSIYSEWQGKGSSHWLIPKLDLIQAEFSCPLTKDRGIAWRLKVGTLMIATRQQPKATLAPSAAGQGLELTAPRPHPLESSGGHGLLSSVSCLLQSSALSAVLSTKRTWNYLCTLHQSSYPDALQLNVSSRIIWWKQWQKFGSWLLFPPPPPFPLALNWPFGLIKHLYRGGWMIFPVILPEARKWSRNEN